MNEWSWVLAGYGLAYGGLMAYALRLHARLRTERARSGDDA